MDRDWTREALCSRHHRPELNGMAYTTDGAGNVQLGSWGGSTVPWDWTDDPLGSLLAVETCARCPVQYDCAAEAVLYLDRVDEHTIRGGLTPGDLRVLAKRLRLPHRREAQHGTRSRYTAGCRCEDCKRAHREYEHERRLQSSPLGKRAATTSR